MFYLVIPLAGAGILLAPRIIQFVYGAGYTGAVADLRILLLYFLAAPLNTVWGYGLIAAGMEKRFFKVMGIASGVSSCSILLLGISYGSAGACCGLLAGEVCGLVLMRTEISRIFQFTVARNIPRPAAATLIMLALISLLHRLPLFALVIIGIAVYFTAVYLFKGFTREELKEMRAAIRE
jgi:O-antigen/teichoic acid export membrane protein